MCGIAGIFDTRGERPIDERLLERMGRLLAHRGPDAGTRHLEPGLGLASRRLSIIDVARGHQPVYNEDGSVVVVFNGEIYNFPALTAELSEAGHRFRTHCDTEVIVHAWEEWGEECVERFRGMFAFALWDRGRRSLFLARDQLGIKPLHYAQLPDGRLLFASELKALLLDPGFPRALDARSIEDYFAFGYVPDPRTIFRSAQKLPPGHTLLVRRGGRAPEPRRYWDVDFSPRTVKDVAETCAELLEQLREAVRLQLVSEVPLGAFLSGGVDSASVVATMARLSTEPVNTCTMSFSDPAFDEAESAAEVARRYGTAHHVGQVEADDFGLVDRLARLYDEPFADSSAIPTYRVSELARQRVTVALSGDGGDEGFAGYRRYRWHLYEQKVRQSVPGFLRRPVFGFLGAAYPKLDWAPPFVRGKTTFQALAREALGAYFHSVSISTDDLRNRLYSSRLKRELDGYNAVRVFEDHAERAPDHPLSLVQYLDFKTYLPGDILTKVDRASMAHSLEVRVPLLDHVFVQWAAGLPPELKLKRSESKWIFKEAVRPLLPPELLRRRKMGFSVPLAAWFRGPLRERTRQALLGPTLADSGYFEREVLRELVERHQSGRRDHSATIWSLLMFESFCRQVLGGEQPDLAPDASGGPQLNARPAAAGA